MTEKILYIVAEGYTPADLSEKVNGIINNSDMVPWGDLHSRRFADNSVKYFQALVSRSLSS